VAKDNLGYQSPRKDISSWITKIKFLSGRSSKKSIEIATLPYSRTPWYR
jgi:hypothetical protein